jgi:carbonic anhydrase
MKKLIQGIIRFRLERRQDYADTFTQLALGQKPDALFIACSDSRVAVNVFASTDPGDLFVLRNVGNLVPPYGHTGGTGTAAAVDFAINKLGVSNIIVCGHSDCGAMHAHTQGHDSLPEGALREWLDMAATGEGKGLDVNEASRKNVLAQLGHLKGYPSVAQAMNQRHLALHGIWFDIRHLDVLYYEEGSQEWTLLDEVEGQRIFDRLKEQS